MSTDNRFFVPGVILGIAIGLYIVGQFAINSSQSAAMFGMVFTLLSVPTCFVGVIFLAYALGKPGEKITVTMIVQDVSNPLITKIPNLEQYGDPASQGYGALMISLSILSGVGAIAFWMIALISSMGPGLGGSGGSCDEFCQTTANLGTFSCVGGILLFVGGLIALARPWAWFGNQPKVVVMPSNESNQEDLSSFTVIQLKEKLKEKRLPVSGKKEDLIARLKTGGETQKAAKKYIRKCSNCQRDLKIPVGYEGRIKCPTCDTISTL